MKRAWFVSLALTCFVGALWLKPEPTALEQSREPSGKKITEVAFPRKVSVQPNQIPPSADLPPRQKSSAISIADSYLVSHRERLGIQSYHELKPEEYLSPLGTVVKYTVYQGKHLVMGLDLEIFVNRKGAVSRVNNGYRPVEEASEEAWNQPVRHFTDGLTQFQIENPPLALFYASASDALKAEAAYAVEVKNKATGETHQGVFRASDGQVLALSKGRIEP